MKERSLQKLVNNSDFEWFNCLVYQKCAPQYSGFKAYSGEQISQLIEAKQTEIRNAQLTVKRLEVLIVEDNPLEFITSFLAAAMARVNLFLADPAWGQREWEQVGALTQPQLIFGDRSTASFFLKKHAPPKIAPAIKDSLIMIPTGGTSGKIRFAMHTWQTLSASVTGFSSYFNCPVINSCCTLPLYHVSGLMQLMRSWLTKGKLIIAPYKVLFTEKLPFNPAEFLISLVPTQLGVAINSNPKLLAQFKLVLLGGAPAGRSLLEKSRQAHISLAPIYGMTETASGVVALQPQDFLEGNHSQGQVLPHAEIKLSQESDITKQSPNLNSNQSRAGIIKITSSSLCLGYYPQFFNKAAFLTDDLGYFDQNGFLWLLGRNSHKIITGGENVYPPEVESVILATNLVSDVSVIGLPDSHWGQAVTAICVLKDSLTGSLASIQQEIGSKLAKYKQPKYWITVENIPRNNRGKVKYQTLKAIAEAAVKNLEA